MKKSVLVIFGGDFPLKKKEWWSQFNVVVAPKQFEDLIRKYDSQFVDVGELLDSGNIREASELLTQLSLVDTSDGRKISKVVTHEGYELWWIYYGDLMQKFCIPYTQYKRLLEYLKDFSQITLSAPPYAALFKYFFDSYGNKYSILNESQKNILPIGVLIQGIISLPFLLWIKIRGPKLMVWTSDQFDKNGDYDFRMKIIYEELRKKKINFVEFVRSMEPTSIVLKHAIKRKRPVIYSGAIIVIAQYLSSFFNGKEKKEILALSPVMGSDPNQVFLFKVSTGYLSQTLGTIWSIKTLKLFLKFIGIKAAIINDSTSRNFHEGLACKLLNIKTVGIQHGASLKYTLVSDFTPGFNGNKYLSVDKFGLWSEWWREYYIKNSKAYKPEQLYVSGHMRPLEKSAVFSKQNTRALSGGRIKVLFVSEQMSDPKEVLPYLEALVGDNDICLFVKFRFYGDGFEKWLKNDRPDILEKIDKSRILRGSMHEAISKCDVVVGSHSTGVLEASLQLKLPIFFITKKWGDYFELSSFNKNYSFIADNPHNLLNMIKKSDNIPLDVLKDLRCRFFGDPYRNGSKWVVEEVEKLL